MTFEDEGGTLEEIRAARAGNAIGPGLALLTGVAFLIYLLVKPAAGSVAEDAGTVGQIAVSVLVVVWGLVLMLRCRVHFVTIETDEGNRRIKGSEQGRAQREDGSIRGPWEGVARADPRHHTGRAS